MDFTAAAKEIRLRFDQLIGQLEGLLVEYPNQPFTQPKDEPWVRFLIQWGESFQATLGNSPRFRTPGVLMIQIFQPVAKGDGDTLELADKIKSAFRGQTVNGITWRTPSLASVGRDEQWWQTNVSCPFYFDEVDNAE